MKVINEGAKLPGLRPSAGAQHPRLEHECPSRVTRPGGIQSRPKYSPFVDMRTDCFIHGGIFYLIFTVDIET
jgi:hypothetical protein